MRTHIIQFEIKDGDVQYNVDKVKAEINKLVLEENDVVVLPEMWSTGYRLEEIDTLASDHLEPILSDMKQLAKAHKINIIGGSIANKVDEEVYNTAFVINTAGELVHQYSKMHLVPMLDEPKYLAAGEEKISVFDLNGEKAGLVICYDLRFPELFRDLALMDAKIIFVVAEWPIERTEHWRTLLKARAIESQCYIVGSNVVGTQTNGTTFAGHSVIIDPFGIVLAEGDDKSEQVVSETIDVSRISQIREDVPIFKSRRKELYHFK